MPAPLAASGPAIAFRAAVAADSGEVLALIRELAAFEKLLDQVVATEDQLRLSLFGEKAYAEVLLAHVDNTLAAFCLFFHNFSTFLGKPGIYIEDIYVRPEFRKLGIGKRYFREIARIARERKCGRIEWAVLDWNQPAIDFYHRLGAHPLDEWKLYRLDAAAIHKL